MDRILTSYEPNLESNLYTMNVRRFIEESGFDVVPMKKVLTNPKLFMRCRIFNFNWFDEANSRKEYIFKSLVLALLKINKKKIVYTLHNKQPHDQEKNSYSLRLMKKMCRISDVIVGLCPDTDKVIRSLYPAAAGKLRVIPHPNYIQNYDVYGEENLRKKYQFDDEDMVLLFLGYISPYKNIELIIEIIKNIPDKRIKLLIAGKVSSEEYRDEIIRMISGASNIKYDFRYIPDDEIVGFYNTCDIVVLPYHKNSSLNSGAAYLSFSLRKTVVCPDIGTINALKDKSFVYSYSYVTEEEHSRKLKECLNRLVMDYERDFESIHQKGFEAYKYVKKYHSDDIIRELYRGTYSSLLKNN